MIDARNYKIKDADKPEFTKEEKKGEVYYTYVETVLPSGKKAGDKVVAGRQRISMPQRPGLKEQ